VKIQVRDFSSAFSPPTSKTARGGINADGIALFVNSLDQVKKDEWAGHVARMEEIRNLYKILLGRLRRRWEYNTRMISSPSHPDRLWGPLGLLSKGYKGSYPGVNGNEPSSFVQGGEFFN
jgi:hypothetical protein